MSCIENGYDYLNNNDNSSNSSSNEISIPKSCSLYNNNEGHDFFEGLYNILLINIWIILGGKCKN